MRITDCTKSRTVLVHHWLTAQRGGEAVFDALLELFPAAPVATLVYDETKASPSLRRRSIQTSILQKLPRSQRWYPYYLPLFPWATKNLDLSAFRLVISSDAATMKGVRTAPGAMQICYCHTPMRYVWSGYDEYASRLGILGRLPYRWLADELRKWDFEAAQRVTHFVANSGTVANRIREFYGRESRVIHPPVETEFFVPNPTRKDEAEFYVLVSHLVPYKRADLVVEAFNRSGKRLVVIGGGSERAKLERVARPNVRILGPQPREVIRQHLQSCKGFVFAGEEDFGIAMAEAQACGAPVLAFCRGGASEIVIDGRTGVLFEEQNVKSLLNGLRRFEGTHFDAAEVRQSAVRFSRERFLSEFASVIHELAGDHWCESGPQLSGKAEVLAGPCNSHYS